jgi:type II secretory pathway pseudopilin PulG
MSSKDQKLNIKNQNVGVPSRRDGFVKEEGVTLIELLIAIFIIGTVVTGMFGLFMLNVRTNYEAERRVIAVALANERAEMIRNLPYAAVGTQGGIPAGAIQQAETIIRHGLTFTVKTDIRYVDDPYDGLITSQPPDTLNIDYKQARIEVSWTAPTAAKPLVLLLHIAPPGIEGGEAAGTLLFTALNAGGQGIEQVTVRLQNSTTTPPVDVTTQTNAQGQVFLPGLPPANGSYGLTVNKSGYTGEQTYSATATFLPDADHSHLSMLVGQLTQKTFAIDRVSQLTIQTKRSPGQQVLGNIAYALKGTKTIGTTNTGDPVYVLNTTGSTNTSGTAVHQNLVWDTYTFSVNGATTGYDIKETTLLLPVVVNPAEDKAMDVYLVEHQPISLHVTVASPTGTPIDNATVHLTRVGTQYDQTLGTGVYGQVYFPDHPNNPNEQLPSNGDYIVDINAPGYQPLTQTITVQDTTRVRFELTPTS